MDLQAIPFEGQYILYRPLRGLAFLGNEALLQYIERRSRGEDMPAMSDVDVFLEEIRFWDPDPEPPEDSPVVGSYRPTMAALLMTTACNLRCAYCYARGGEGEPLFLDPSVAKRVIDAAHANAETLDREQFSLAFHGGGEPTVHWSCLTDAVRHSQSKRLPCHISMSSNGVWTREQREFIVEHMAGLSISFDGIPHVQHAQRPKPDGRNSFDDVMETLIALDDTSVSYGVRLTVMPSTFHTLPESIALLCADTQCPIMQVEPCYADERGRYADPTASQADAFVKAFMEAFTVARDGGRTLVYSGARPWLVTSIFCRAPLEAYVVTPEGDLMSCFETHDRRHALHERFLVGRVSQEGIHVDMDRVNAFFSQQRCRRASCQGCYCYWHCGGDCDSRCMASPEANRIRCVVNKAITAQLLAWSIAEGDYGLRATKMNSTG